MQTRRILIPIPHIDFDPTEVAVSWLTLHQSGVEIVFATPDGERGYGDPVMLSGEGLDPWGNIPILKKITLLGRLLRANGAARSAYQKMEQDPHFLKPIRYDEINWRDYHGLLLPGGHAKGMRPYLEDKTLQAKVVEFFESGLTDFQRPIAAVCHGVVLAARSISERTGKSCLHGFKTTALPWQFEGRVSTLCRYYARWWDPDYYRTYVEQAGEPVGYASVEEEVKRCLESPNDFLNVAENANFHFQKTSGMHRDSRDDERPAWLVKDRHYLSARWPGDVHTFAKAFVDMLEGLPDIGEK